MNVRARRKHLTKLYTRRLGQPCFWRNSQLFERGLFVGPAALKRERAVLGAGGKQVTLTKSGSGTGAGPQC